MKLHVALTPDYSSDTVMSSVISVKNAEELKDGLAQAERELTDQLVTSALRVARFKETFVTQPSAV